MNQLEKWTLPNCSLGIPLRDFSGRQSLMENHRTASSRS